MDYYTCSCLGETNSWVCSWNNSAVLHPNIWYCYDLDSHQVKIELESRKSVFFKNLKHSEAEKSINIPLKPPYFKKFHSILPNIYNRSSNASACLLFSTRTWDKVGANLKRWRISLSKPEVSVTPEVCWMIWKPETSRSHQLRWVFNHVRRVKYDHFVDSWITHLHSSWPRWYGFLWYSHIPVHPDANFGDMVSHGYKRLPVFVCQHPRLYLLE